MRRRRILATCRAFARISRWSAVIRSLLSITLSPSGLELARLRLHCTATRERVVGGGCSSPSREDLVKQVEHVLALARVLLARRRHLLLQMAQAAQRQARPKFAPGDIPGVKVTFDQ